MNRDKLDQSGELATRRWLDNRHLRSTSRGIVRLGVSCACLAVLAIIIASPLLLKQLSKTTQINWARLSSIGQTYGAASAILSAFALLGVAGSLAVQARQVRNERIYAVQQRHVDLLKVVLDDPETYGPAIGTIIPSAEVSAKRFLFTTMYFNYLQLSYRLKIASEESIRKEVLKSAFQSESVRLWWTVVREYWFNNPGQGQRSREFALITDDEYKRAEVAGPPVIRTISVASRHKEPTPASFKWHSSAAVAIGAATGFIIATNIWKRKK